ncbi:hypothetical protein QQF64_013448 [Cirrhinus molitorella]|uniref:Uncharacterized protein n=1 Tax=Cirrhinus molitorella TaxID=172907 RepID=A0ABR3LUW0_9TELE
MLLNCTAHTERQCERTGCKNIPGTIHHQRKFHKDNLQLMWKNRLVMEVREVKTAAERERERRMEEGNLLRPDSLAITPAERQMSGWRQDCWWTVATGG